MNFYNSDLEHFVNSLVWKKLSEDILERALANGLALEELDPATQGTQMARLQGEIAALKWIADLPRILSEDLKIEQEQKQSREEKNNDSRE